MAAERLHATLHNPETTATEQAALARELRMVLGALGARPTLEQQGDGLDELAARRQARRTG